ncbi:MAG: type III polyketide synthase, partial [Proteobacteria bacterium]|nr:type III polyketide synthase [Pseudomonadota bacterium]
LQDDALSTSRSVLADHGNMSSATMLFILERFAAKNQPKPCLMLGFGPGLEIEVLLIH